MIGTARKSRTGHELQLWPVLLLLLIVVLAPTICLLWFMTRAIENERLAARQTLEQAYRRELTAGQHRLENFWQRRALQLDEALAKAPPAEVFAKCIRTNVADAVVCYDEDGRTTYPDHPSRNPAAAIELPSEWEQAPVGIRRRTPGRSRTGVR